MYGRPLRCKENLTFLALEVGCGHVSGLSTRRTWPLALMKYADRLPITGTRFGGAGHNSGLSDPGFDPDRHHVTFVLAIQKLFAVPLQAAGATVASR